MLFDLEQPREILAVGLVHLLLGLVKVVVDVEARRKGRHIGPMRVDVIDVFCARALAKDAAPSEPISFPNRVMFVMVVLTSEAAANAHKRDRSEG